MATDWVALTTRLTRLLLPKYQAALSWTQVTTSIGALSAAEKDSIVQAIRAGQTNTVGLIVVSTVGRALESASHVEASAMLTDQALTTAELDRLFGSP